MVDLSLEQLSPAKKASFAYKSQELEAGEGGPVGAAHRPDGREGSPSQSGSQSPTAGWHFKAETRKGMPALGLLH